MMDSYLVNEDIKLHVCGNSPDCAGYQIEKGHFKIKGYDGPANFSAAARLKPVSQSTTAEEKL